jgi:hypothetical protein
MKTLATVLTEISEITNRIREEFPELYDLLEENKVSVYTGGKKVDGNEFAQYLDSLKEKLEHYIENHEAK